jgi:hypothetical protein
MESKNPYAPPKAVVDDVSSGAAPPRPAQVTRALQLFWTSIAIGFLSGILNLLLTDQPGMSKAALIGSTVIAWSIGFLITWWILSSIGKGKNWARIVQVVFFIIGILGILMVFTMPQKISAIIWVLYAIQMSLNVWGMTLLFSSPSNAWFREMKDWR